MIKTLIDAGQKLERVRAALEDRPDLGDDLAAAPRVIAGDSVVLVREGEDLIDVVNKYQGQGVLNLLALGGVVSDVDAAIHEIRPGGEAQPERPEETSAAR